MERNISYVSYYFFMTRKQVSDETKIKVNSCLGNK